MILKQATKSYSVLTKLSFLFNFCLALQSLIPQMVLAQPQENFRIGYSPNTPNAAALYSRQVKIHEAAMATEISWRAFQSSSLAINAIERGDLEAAYVDPFPVLQELASDTEPKVVIISGAASAGYGLIGRKQSGLSRPRDFVRSTVGISEWWSTPSFVFRAWVRSSDIKIDHNDGLVTFRVVPEVEQLELLRNKKIDSLSGFEPWLSVAESRAGASRIEVSLADLPQNLPSAVLVVSLKFYQQQHEKLQSLLRGHVEAVQSINRDGDKALKLVMAQIKEDTEFDVSLDELKSSFSRTKISWSITPGELEESAGVASKLGYLKRTVKIANVLKLDALEVVLKREKIQ